ncbi:MAG: S24 family peptidase [Janthinobacterium lividum]
MAVTTLTRLANNKTGHRLSAGTVEKLHDAFPDFFAGADRPDGPPDYVEVEMLPSFGGMGGGGDGEGEPGRFLIPRLLVEERLRASPSDLLLIDVRGDSMKPDFEHGDQILIDRRDRDPRQPGAFCLWDGDGYVVKLVERVPNKPGWLRVFSANSRYTPYDILQEEARILGRPVWFARAL